MLRVTAEDPAVRSVVCLGRTTTTLPISRAYDAFVRAPTGVVERAVGHPAFRVDVSAPIDDGESWQLGLYLAHRLKAVGRLAEDVAPADLVLWATGAVDGDLAVHPVERVAEKRRRSASVLDAPGARLLAVVPSGQADALADLPNGAEVLAVSAVGPVLRRLGLERAPAPRRAARPLAVAALVGLAALAVGVVALRDHLPVDPPAVPTADPAAPAFDPAAVRMVVMERRPVDGGACGGAERSVTVEPGRQTEPGGCGIAVEASNAGAAAGFAWLIAIAEGDFREYAGKARSFDRATGPITPGGTVRVQLDAPPWIRRAVGFRIVLIAAPDERAEVSRLLGDLKAPTGAEIDELIARLTALGVQVRSVRHQVRPRA